jgi:hypothetical protein
MQEPFRPVFIERRITMRGVLTLVVLAVGTPSFAGLIAEDGFDYPAGTITTQGGQGWRAGDIWSGSAQAVAPGLTYPDLLSVGANTYQGSGQHYRYIDTSAGSLAAAAGVLDGSNNIGADGSTVWMSFIGYKDTASWGGVSPYRDGSEQHFIGHNGGGTHNWGVIPYGDGGGGIHSSTKSAHTDSLVVLKWDFTSGTDTTQMWVNPVIANGEAGLGAADVTVTRTGFSFNRIRLGNGGGLLTVDELRLGTTFADVTPTSIIPEPATLLVWSLLAGLGLAASWRRRKR